MFNFPNVEKTFYAPFNDLIKLGFTFEVRAENELDWTELNEIHFVLNKSYSPRTRTFYAKLFAHRLPIKRVLCRYKDKLVGISSYFEDYILINDQRILIGGVGLTCSIMPGHGIGNKLRYAVACGIGSETGVPFCIGRVNSNERVRTSLKDLVYCFLDIPLVGKTTQSHEWETIAVYKTSKLNKNVELSYLQHLNSISTLLIEGETF